VDEAIAEYKEILTLDPGLPVVHFNLGVAWQRKGRVEEASSSFREAIRLKPTYIEALANLGHLTLKKGDVDSAVNYCRAAIAINPDFFEGLCVLSIALILKNDSSVLEEAAELGKKAVTLRPMHCEAHLILGIVFENMAKLAEAEAQYR
jgi:Flp pilus assembly protein TadD